MVLFTGYTSSLEISHINVQFQFCLTFWLMIHSLLYWPWQPTVYCHCVSTDLDTQGLHGIPHRPPTQEVIQSRTIIFTKLGEGVGHRVLDVCERDKHM